MHIVVNYAHDIHDRFECMYHMYVCMLCVHFFILIFNTFSISFLATTILAINIEAGHMPRCQKKRSIKTHMSHE